jgi:imidazolonepropionase-like amidohydrolase
MKYIFLLFFLPFITCQAQLIPVEGIKDSEASYYCLENATILVSPTKTIEDASLLIQGSTIIEIGQKIKIPEGTIIIDCKGKYILPAFIESFSNIGLPPVDNQSSSQRKPIEYSNLTATYWNEAIHPEFNASNYYEIDSKQNDQLIQMGFGLAVSHLQNGIARGNGVLVSLGSQQIENQIIKTDPASFFSFEPGNSRNPYPSSQVGAIALLRQTFYDLEWYTKTKPSERNLSLDALQSQVKSPMIFQAEDKWEVLRISKIGKEFNYPFIFMGTGTEYGIIPQLSQLNNKLIIPINFPLAYDVADPYIIKQIPLKDLKEWELAPSNPYLLKQAKINFSISSYGISNPNTFWDNLRKAIERGLHPSDALQALTIEPAKNFGIDRDYGTLEKGKKATFMIYNHNPFVEKAILTESWILGKQTILEKIDHLDITGKYNILITGKKYPLEITGEGDKLQAKITSYKHIVSEKNKSNSDTLYPETKIKLIGNNLTLQFNLDDDNWKGSVNLHAKVNAKLGIFEGDGMLPDGQWVKWTAIRNTKGELKPKEKQIAKIDTSFHPSVWYPNMAFGFDTIAQQRNLVIRNITIWTNEKEGIIPNATVVCENGKITYVGTGKPPFPKNALVIDGTGKHLTCGIIDEHSHIALSKGVNEGTQAVTAEVNMGDVINPEDINIYRQLAGGVTAAQLLHGSANPIGGQSALIKLKWSHPADDFLIPNAPKFIKFALGENVKQSNWGYYSQRFPQTRMGVEQVFYDAFNRADIYQEILKKHAKHAKSDTPRKDLELEAMVEILNGERHITCHSYVQSEINMLLHLADSIGIKINTFTHILEGYKVADKMAKYGSAGSTFSDWWAYKYEVNDAIPYNAKIMSDMGVLVGLNSDDAEMGRRLNQEAAKMVKYGGMSEIEAWKLVTLNPAIMLHLDNRMGSIVAGKDADIVIWSTNPLSIEAKVEYTIIDGEILYDAVEEKEMIEKNQKEKARIISKMLESNNKGGDKKPFVKKRRKLYHCDTLEMEGTESENHH